MMVQALGLFGPVSFVFFCILGTLVFVPTPVLYFAAGVSFGIPLGFALVSAAFLLNAAGFFWVGRHLSRKWVIKKIGLHAKVKAVDDAVTDYGWKMVLLIRMTGILPFSMMNYALGLSNIPFRHYLFASWIGAMPGMFMYLYLGSLAGETVLEAGARPRAAVEWVLFGVGSLVTFMLGLYATLIVRRVLRAHGPSRLPGDAAATWIG